jgi:3,4-dihydroxy 2-butanone 4-phosphate synthase / GTP cyclohydrolase II
MSTGPETTRVPLSDQAHPAIVHAPSPPASQADSVGSLLASLLHLPGGEPEGVSGDERPLHGTTLFIARCGVDTRFGPFEAFIFQDLTDKHYVIALAHGEIASAKVLYTRLHSSCVTSETLRGCDCDCVQQLEGAFKVIAERGTGILFYLMQEGRGVGYAGKARDRMLVQASLDQLSTFEAYAAMGLKKDHRNYENISHICHLLGLRAPFVVLTNNPDKVEALRSQGLAVAGTERLEFEPSPYNLAYLASKASGGHILSRPQEASVKRAQPPGPVHTFRPHALPHARRFVYVASYYLPMKPVDNDVLLGEREFRRLTDAGGASLSPGGTPLVLGYQMLRGGRFFVKVEAEALAALRREDPGHAVVGLLSTPYWFRVHVYYDIVTCQEFVVLTHGEAGPGDLPVVRLHSESLFNRFPLRTVENRDKFKQSVKHIVTYGVGALQLLYNDGRGAGFGAHATDLMLTARGHAGSTDDAYRQLGVEYDSRDYDAAMILLRHHVPDARIQMVMNSPASLVRKPEYAEALNRHRIEVAEWIFLDEGP